MKTGEMKKRVLLIATVQSHIGQFHKPLMQLLKENGWEIHVAARNNLDEKDGLQLEYPDKVFDVPFQRSPFDRRNIRAYKHLNRILEKNHYDVIHCNTPVGGILGRIAGQKYRGEGTQIYYTAHGFHFYKGASLINWIVYYPIEKWMSRLTDKLITITEEDYKLANGRFHCPVYRIHGVGANSSRYYPISEEEQVIKKKKLGIEGHMLVCVGELLPNKNQKTAILALKHIVKGYPDTHLFLAGNGPERLRLERLVADEGLETSITFLGYTLKLHEYLQTCDAEIACSYREGLPLNIMEAMMCGKAVVASHNRGHNELVVNGVTGYLVDPDDPEGFSKAVSHVFEKRMEFTEPALHYVVPFIDINVQKELKRIYCL